MNDGFAGGTADAALHADHTSVVRRPTVAVTKQIRNVTTAGSFAATATGDAGDTLEYRLTLELRKCTCF